MQNKKLSMNLHDALWEKSLGGALLEGGLF